MNFIQKLAEKIYLNTEGNLAYYDKLSGCLNRNWLEDNSYICNEQFVTVFDINDFKSINDTRGHVYGDGIIVSIAQQLNKIKKYDNEAKVIRFGGDEFLVVSSMDPTSMIEEIDGNNRVVSYGVYHQSINEPLEVALCKADKIMYEYKKKYKKTLKRRKSDKKSDENQ